MPAPGYVYQIIQLLYEQVDAIGLKFRVLKARNIIGVTMSRASKDDLDRLRQRIESLRRDAKERPHLANVLLTVVDELENKLKRLREQNGETGNS